MDTEQPEQRANEILLDMLEKASGAVDFAAGQVPEVVEQLLLWHSVRGLILFCAGVAVFLVIGLLFCRVSAYVKVEREKGKYSDTELVYVPFGACAVIASILGLIFLSGGLDFLKIQLAPKLYLLEYAAGLVK